jgi:suppressor of fused protein SUFU
MAMSKTAGEPVLERVIQYKTTGPPVIAFKRSRQNTEANWVEPREANASRPLRTRGAFGCWTFDMLDDPMAMSLQQQILMAHYNQNWGIATTVLRYAFSEQPQDAPFVAEFFVGTETEPLYVYATLGMSDLPMPNTTNDVRAELFLYSRVAYDNLGQTLARLAVYPFQNNLGLAALDTIYGSRPLVDSSALSSVLLTLPVREPEDFGIVDTGDISVQLLMVTPISEAERRVCVDQDAFTLLGLFAEHEVDPTDLMRASVV